MTGYQETIGVDKCFNCLTINYGCLTCNPNSKICISCDDSLYFEQSLNTDGICVCQANRRLNDDNSSCLCLNHFYDNAGVC